MEHNQYRWKLVAVMVALAGCLSSVAAEAQPLLATSGVMPDSCTDSGPPPCMSGAVYVRDGRTLDGKGSLTLWRGLRDAHIGKLVVDGPGIFLYAAGSQGSGPTTTRWIDVVDLRAMTKVATYAVSGSLIAITPDGSRLYLTGASGVSVIAAATGAAVASIPTADGVDMVVSPTDGRLYIATQEGLFTFIQVVHGTTLQLLDTVVVFYSISQLRVSADGAHLYGLTAGGVLDIETPSNTLARVFGILGSADRFDHLAVAGGRLFVTKSQGAPGTRSAEVDVIDVSTHQQDFLYGRAGYGDSYLIEASDDGTRVFVSSAPLSESHTTFSEFHTIEVATRERTGGFLYLSEPAAVAAIPTHPIASVIADQPAAGATVRQPFLRSGWAADNTIWASGPGVSTVHVWAYPAGGGAPTFLGADYGRPRPDVGAYLGPTFTNAGYAVSVRGLQPGAYRLVAYAFSLATGQFSLVTEVPVTIAPTAQLVLDTPTADSRVSWPLHAGRLGDRHSRAGGHRCRRGACLGPSGNRGRTGLCRGCRDRRCAA